MNIFRKRSLIVAASAAVLFAGCRAAEDVAGSAPGKPQATETAAPAERMLVWTASLSLVVNDPAAAAARAAEIAEKSGGYVEEKSSYESTIGMKLRVPAKALPSALDALGTLGSVSSRFVSAQDVTESCIDLEARLKNASALRDRLKALVEQAKDVKDVLAIETELTRVQSEVDSMEGRLKAMKGRVALAEVSLDIRRQRILGPVGLLFQGLGWTIGKLFVIQE